MDAIRRTISLPVDLVDAADKAVRAGLAPNRNTLLIEALRHELTALRRQRIDADLAAMSDDPELQAEADSIGRELRHADAESAKLAASNQ
jgi:metal-responsive CopG/Arc/MetJ family transcriptional regulator